MAYLGHRPAVGENNSFRILDDISSYVLTFDGSSASVVSLSNETITMTEDKHRYITGQRVTYSNGGGGNITGLTNGQAYFVINHSSTEIKLASSASNALAGTAIDLTGLGTGSSHTLTLAFDGVNTKFVPTFGNGLHDTLIKRAAQLVISLNGVIQQPHDTATPTTGFGVDALGNLIFSTAPASTDIFWAHVLATNTVTFDSSDNDVDTFTGNGSATSFTLSKVPPDNRNILVTIDGVVQYPSDAANTRSYSVSENVMTFVAAPGNGTVIQVRHIGYAGPTAGGGSGGVTGFYGRTGNVSLQSTDNIVANNATFSGNVSIAKTLTYEDVTDVDAIGLITARSGIDCNGDLDVDGHTELDNVNIAGITTFNSGMFIPDNQVIHLGNVSGTGDLQIYHDTNHSYVKDVGTGDLVLQTQGGHVLIKYGNDTMAFFQPSNKAELYFANSPKLATTNTGITVTGQGVFSSAITASTYIQGTSSNGGLKFYSDSSASKGVVLNTDDHLVPSHDSNSDLGLNGTRWRNLYADTLYGDGSNLTGISGISVANQADNRLITATGTTDALNAESGLTWDGATLLASGSDAQLRLYDSTASSENSAFRLMAYNGVNMIQSGKAFSSDSKADLVFGSMFGGTEWARINTNGYVNIGTGSAEQQLTVQNSAQHSLIRVISKNDSDAGIDFGDTDDTDRAGIRYTNSSDSLAIIANADTRVVIDSSGRVMIGGGSSPSQVGDGRLIVYSTDRLHPAIKCAGMSNNYANGWTLLGDNYTATESNINLGLSYSSASLVLSKGVKVSGSADDTYLSSQAQYATRPCAIKLDGLGAFNFLTTETNATTAVDSVVSLTKVFTIDRVGNVYQRISGRNIYLGASQQLRIGVQSNGDPNIEAVSGDLKLMKGGSTIMQLRSDGFEMAQGIYPANDDSKDLGKSGRRWANIYTTDLHLSNEGKSNVVDGTWGDWTLQEGEHKIYMINNRTGKKYSLKMEEE